MEINRKLKVIEGHLENASKPKNKRFRSPEETNK